MKFKEAQNLIKLPKWVVDENGEIVKSMTIEHLFPMRFRLNMVSAFDQNRMVI